MDYPIANLNIKTEVKKFLQEGDLSYKYSAFRNMQDESGALVDMNNKDLNFKLTHPVEIDVQPSYDGTVNLILNDDVNPPRIINSRFSVVEDKRFKIIDRNGDNDTNIYNTENFDLETRLFKNSNNIPFIDFLGLQEGGNLKAGNYSFYFKYVDADGNESDIIAESGTIPVHEGGLNDPSSISGGVLDTNCNKIIKLKISNLDPSYDYLNIYYYRTSGQDSFARNDEYVQILDRKIITGENLEITITGFENIKTVDETLLNVEYNIVDKVKTQTQVQNMLFFGNVDKPSIPYKELTDLSLRVIPSVVNTNSIGFLNENYTPISGDPEKIEYYNMKNVYYFTGYWNNEIYSLGMVYILKDDSISPVFNIRGCDNLGMAGVKMKDFDFYQMENNVPKLDSNGNPIRQYIPISEDGFLQQGSAQFENTRGVVRLRADVPLIDKVDNTDIKTIKPLGLKFEMPDIVLEEIKKFAKGFFFVRQKRIPTILAQGLTIGVDSESYLPCVKDETGVVAESFIDSSRLLTSIFDRHRLDPSKYGTNVRFRGILSPEVSVNQFMFSGLFNNSELSISSGFFDNTNNYLSRVGRHLYIRDYNTSTSRPLSRTYTKNKIVNVSDGTPLKSTGSQYFSALAGMAEDGSKFKYFGIKNKETKAVNLIRGKFTGFLGCEKELPEHKIVNIHTPGYSTALMEEYFKIRFNSLSAYYAISDRYDVKKIKTEYHKNISIDNKLNISFTEYRGDCFINTVTVRMNRNFIDSEVPLNNEIIDVNTWKDYYIVQGDSDSKKDNNKINRPDVNSVELGHWVTFKICSTFNLALRCLDSSNVDESALLGKPRGFFPVQSMSAKSENKAPESTLFNVGYSITVPNKQYVRVPDVPYLKNNFENRIMFSQRHVNDAFQNGYRVFQGLQYQDITKQYGAIVKIFNWKDSLLVIFENGIALLPINERAMIQTETGQGVYMYGAGVLPEKETPISIDYGSRWSESIVRTPMGIYGVDTEAKKIWRFNDSGFTLISDFKIGKYLNDNIKFTSDEHFPILGLRNVKTHYDNFKGDLIFTFYDKTRNDKVDFNLVYNERIDKWITRTTWTPISSANINNIFITFDKKVSESIALNAYTLEGTEISEGLVLSSNIFKVGEIGKFKIKSYDYYNSYNKTYSIIEGNEDNLFSISRDSLLGTGNLSEPRILKINVELTKDNLTAPDFKEYVYIVPENTEIAKPQFLYKHGFANLFDESENPIPLKWYDDSTHKFEFEFIVNDLFYTQKIFDNLKIISNKTQPDELQVWIEGDGYHFDTSQALPTKQTIKSFHGKDKNGKEYGRVRGNAHYNENKWDIEIKPFKIDKKEFRLRDKYAKIRVVYSGQNPAIITAIQTLYTISYV